LVIENSYLSIFVCHSVLRKRLIANFAAGCSLGISISPPDVLALCFATGARHNVSEPRPINDLVESI
jgi:hypothetical protein